jgi:hypothetical protein
MARWAALLLGVACRAAAPAPVGEVVVAALGRDGLAALRRCERTVGVELGAWRPGGSLGLSGSEVRRACGEAEVALERHFDAVAGRYRESIQPLDGLARVAEDSRVLAILLDEGERGPPLAAAIDHLRRALTEERATMERAAGAAAARAVVVEAVSMPGDELRRRVRQAVENDVHDIGQLADLFDRHARQQSEARYVRRWSLRTAGAWAEAVVRRHREATVAWTSTDPAGAAAAAAFATYVTACEALIEAWRASLAAYPPGAIPADEGAAALAALQAAHARWSAAQLAALAALGPA